MALIRFPCPKLSYLIYLFSQLATTKRKFCSGIQISQAINKYLSLHYIFSLRKIRNFLRAIKEGQRAPTEWQGDLDVDYFLGPELKNGWKIKMEIHTANKVATIHNTIAILNGEEEPGKLK